MSQKPEAVFQGQVIKYLRGLYGPRLWVVNVCGGLGMRSGIPDLLMCLDGQFIALELKNPKTGGRLGPKQEKELDELKAAGAIAEVIASWQDLKRIIDRFPPRQLVIG